MGKAGWSTPHSASSWFTCFSDRPWHITVDFDGTFDSLFLSFHSLANNIHWENDLSTEKKKQNWRFFLHRWIFLLRNLSLVKGCLTFYHSMGPLKVKIFPWGSVAKRTTSIPLLFLKKVYGASWTIYTRDVKLKFFEMPLSTIFRLKIYGLVV